MATTNESNTGAGEHDADRQKTREHAEETAEAARERAVDDGSAAADAIRDGTRECEPADKTTEGPGEHGHAEVDTDEAYERAHADAGVAGEQAPAAVAADGAAQFVPADANGVHAHAASDEGHEAARPRTTVAGNRAGAGKPKTKGQQDLLDAALYYATLGWKVFPLHSPVRDEDGIVECSCRKLDCKSPAKHPRILNWPHEASSDPEKIRSWWSMWPNANIGICTGTVSGITVIDVDVNHNGMQNFRDLKDSKPETIPHIPQVITGGGGMHLYFKTPSGVKIGNSASKFTRGVDVRGDGGFVVGAPSEHARGRQYEWELSSDVRDTPLADMPGWLLEAAASDATPNAHPRVASNTTMTDGVFVQGERNDLLLRLGRSLLAKGMDEPGINAALQSHNTTKCEPPLDEKEMKDIVTSVMKKEPGTTNSKRGKEAVEATEKLTRELQEADEITKLAGPQSFARGDAVELATRLLVDARGDSPVSVVFDRGEFYRYEQHSGLWMVIQRELLVRHVGRYAGAPLGDKVVKVSDGLINGSISVASSFAMKRFFFDNAPPGMMFQNGFVMLMDDGEIRLIERSPDHRARFGMESDWNTGLQAPKFLKFMLDIFTPDDEEEFYTPEEDKKKIERVKTIHLIMEFIGACLIGDATRYAIALVLYGETAANGKSTLIEIVKALFPPGSVKSLAPSKWGDRFYLAELALARLNAVSEMPTSEIGASDLFKSVVSGDDVMVARKFKDPFDMRPRAGHIMACNELPATTDQTEGFWRRFMVVEFNRHFAKSERDLNVAKRIIANELGAIAVKAIEAASRLRRQGQYTEPESSIKAKERWKGESDPIRIWLLERTKRCNGNCGLRCKETYSKNCSVLPPEAYASYREWCKEVGAPSTMPKRTFLIGLKRILGQRRHMDLRWYAVYLYSR